METTSMFLQAFMVLVNFFPLSTAIYDTSTVMWDNDNITTSTSTSTTSSNETYNVTGDGDDILSLLAKGTQPPRWPIYQPIYITILNVVVFFTGTVGNVLVVLVVALVRDMRTPMNWYLVNLSLADLLVLIVCQPAALTEFFARDRWFLGKILCKMVPFLEHTVLHASTLIILAITVERYYAICRPMRKLAMCHRPRPLKVLPCVWTFAALTSVPFVVMTHLQPTFFFDGTPCEVCATSVKESWHFTYIIGMFVSFSLPMLLLLILYSRIIACLKSSGTSLRIRRVNDVVALNTHRTRKNVIKMLVGIVVLFFISLMPVRCVIIWQIFTPDVQIKGMGPERYYNLIWICRLLMYVNSAGNPVIYSLISSKFQEAFWRLLTGRRNESSRGSVFSRHSSASRVSLSDIHRSCLSPKLGSSFRLVVQPNPDRIVVNGQRPSKVMLKRNRTASLSTCISSQDIPASSPLMKRAKPKPFTYQRSCVNIL